MMRRRLLVFLITRKSKCILTPTFTCAMNLACNVGDKSIFYPLEHVLLCWWYAKFISHILMFQKEKKKKTNKIREIFG